MVSIEEKLAHWLKKSEKWKKEPQTGLESIQGLGIFFTRATETPNKIIIYNRNPFCYIISFDLEEKRFITEEYLPFKNNLTDEFLEEILWNIKHIL